MSQTTNGMSMRNATIEYSLNGSTWTDMSGFSNTVEPDGGERDVEDTHTFDGDTPIQTPGKRAGREVKVKIVYTETLTDPYEVVRDVYEDGDPFYLRWSPKGGGSGANMFTTAAGIVTQCPPPGGEAGSAAAIAIEFTVKTPEITKSVVTP